MLPDLLGAAVVAAVIAVPFVSRRLRGTARARAAGTAAVSPVRPGAAGGMAAPAVTVQPRGEVTGPYGYDNGVLTGAPYEGES